MGEKTEPGTAAPSGAESEFDRLAARYDLYVPWESRLAREIPFLEERLRRAGARRVLDCGCGPGRHAVALARKGFEVTGLDASPVMLELARRHAEEAGVAVSFVEGRFEDLPAAAPGPFDAAICLGNSLAAVEPEALEDVVRGLHAVLRPGGVAVTQTVDFDVVAAEPVTASPVRAVRGEDGTELLFVKSFVRVDEHVFIHWVTLERRDEAWTSEVTFHPIEVVEPARLQEIARRAGFAVEALGDYEGRPFVKGRSRDLILVATRIG